MTPSPPGHLTPSEDQLAIQFALDGVSLQTERTAIKKFQHPDVVENPLWAVTFGAFLVPGSLSLGSQEIKTSIHDLVSGDEEFTTPFSVIAC